MHRKHKKSEKEISGFGYWGGTGQTPIGISYGDIESGTNPKDPRHYRKESTVYFIVMTGILLLEVDGETHRVDNEFVFELSPKTVYRVLGSEVGDCKWIAINTVNEHGDKIVLDEQDD
jgi:mannose-6-phosphate isomerase-like protein (cupin superfamily)